MPKYLFLRTVKPRLYNSWLQVFFFLHYRYGRPEKSSVTNRGYEIKRPLENINIPENF